MCSESIVWLLLWLCYPLQQPHPPWFLGHCHLESISSIVYRFPVSGSAVPTVRSGLHRKLITELLKVASTHLTILFLTVLVKDMSSWSSHCGSVGLKWQIHCLSIKPREAQHAHLFTVDHLFIYFSANQLNKLLELFLTPEPHIKCRISA